MAYTLDGVADPSRRPLMFSFNGGPGSASVWLHLGALGPKRVKMLDDGMMPAPPYELADNESTWLPDTDLVFIDPVGTGYSRPTKPELGAKFWGLDGDIQSVA
ncbi:MAG TPA: peptidase S1, partial [Pyrinomonadaceae bacterium]|nr:peptidase S1 [Pyrinomonadaceae bacterium]